MEDQKLQSAEDSAEPGQTGAESAPASEETHEEKVSFSDEQQAKVDEIIGQKTFKGRQRERELQAELESERKAREEAESKIPAKTRPDILPMPDQYDENYAEKMQARDQSIARAADYDADERAKRKALEMEEERRVIEQSQQLQATVDEYAKRAIRDGISEQELAQISDSISNFQLDDSIAKYILMDDSGALIAKYLASNLSELDEITRSDPTLGLAYIVEKVKPKASSLIVKTTDAPDPPELLKGSGMPPRKRGVPGATFE